MPDRVKALLAASPGLERASRLTDVRVPVLPVLEKVLPHHGLRPGTAVEVVGPGATSLALALIAGASRRSWTAVVGARALGLKAAEELGVDLDRLVVVPDPGTNWTPVLSAAVDAFDVVVTQGSGARGRSARRLLARVRERDAVLVVVGAWPHADVRIEASGVVWHGIGWGCGHLHGRTLTVKVGGRGMASRLKQATLLLPDPGGGISPAKGHGDSVTPIRRTG